MNHLKSKLRGPVSLFGRLPLAALALVLGLAAVATAPSRPALGQGIAPPAPTAPPTAPAALADEHAQLWDQAMTAIRGGRFDQGADLLNRLADASTDDSLDRLSTWAREFEAQRRVLADQRREQFERALADVRRLVEAGAYDLAIDFAVRAYVLAEDKQAFADSELIRRIVAQATALAEQYEAAEQWVKALRVYSDLTQIQPAEPRWRNELRDTTRRIRMLALYAPDALTRLREDEAELLERLDRIIPPAATRPARRPAGEVDPAFQIDWRENLRGIRADMLWQSLIDVRANYWREVEFKSLIRGGIEGVRTLVSTRGLETAFPTLADAAQRDAFLAGLRQLEDRLAAAPRTMEVLESNRIYRDLLTLNSQTLALPEEVIVHEFADGALAQCDPFTSMIWPNEVDDFTRTTQGEFSGVGIQIQSDVDGSLRVVSPIEDSPAFRAGIKAGDIITHVDGRPIKGITTSQAVRIITGPRGTTVTLTIRSFDGSSREVPLQRDTIKVASVKGFAHRPGGGWDYFIDPDNRIAYLRLTNFTRTSGAELEAAVAELQALGARALIFDLRYNPGGLLPAAIDVTNRFLDRGVIVSTRAARNTPQRPTAASARPEPNEVTIPTVILINQYSASASEIVAGALRDHGRAILVGERTFGKGSVQMLFTASTRNAYLKLTTSHYFLPSGRSIHREESSTSWGVDPDIVVEMTPEQMLTAQRARSELDVLRQAGTPAPLPPGAGERPNVQSEADLIRYDNQLGAALLLLRFQLNGAQVARATPAPGLDAAP